MIKTIFFFILTKLAFAFFVPQHLEALAEKPIVVITPSYNNIEWVEKNLVSILTQKYSNFRLIYIDDHSSDGTADMVIDLARELGQEDKILLIRNSERKGSLANIYSAIMLCRDDEIAAIVDGDDWLYHDQVLNRINEAYSKGEVWLTHGTLIEYPSYTIAWSLPIPSYIIEANTFRLFRCPSHLRTFYAWLFKKIVPEDLKCNGHFFEMTGDQAIMLPMIEMAGSRHAFIDDVVYVYNMANMINDNKVDPLLQRHLEELIRSKQPYQPL